MIKKIITVFLTGALLCSMTACNNAENTNTATTTPVPTTDITETVQPTLTPAATNTPQPTETPVPTPTEAPAPTAITVYPLPVTLDINNLDNCTVAVSFEKEDFIKADDGTTCLKATVHTYDLYDLVDVSPLKEGDTIVLRGEKVTISSISHTEYGSIEINGGLDMGGYELRTDNHTVYFETGYSDVKSYYALGEVTLPVSDTFVFTDGFDLDKGETLYSLDDFLAEKTAFYFSFTPHDTTIVIEDGQIIAMKRIYTP